MKIVILSMPVHHSIDYSGMSTMPPTAIYLLGAILKESGYTVDIIDPYYFRKLNPIDTAQNEKVKKYFEKILYNADVACISSNTLNWSMAKVACEIIREICPNIKIVMGGLHPTYFDEYVINTNSVDFVLRGDGEKSLPSLMNAIEIGKNYENVPGLTWISNGSIIKNQDVEPLSKEEILKVPFPDFSSVPEKVYGIIPVDTSKGCRYACRFCSIPHKHDWIGYEAEWAANRLLSIVEKYGERFTSQCVYIVDDCFTVDNERAMKILRCIIEKKPDIQLILEARASDLKEEKLLEILKLPQIIRVAIGVECGYDIGLKNINKGLTIELLEQRLEKFYGFDLIKKMFFSFIIGFPWERVQDYKLTIDYAASIVERFGYPNVNLNWLNLLPSDIWNNRRKYGIMLNENIFDVHGILKNEKIFKETHPRVDIYARKFVDDYICSYKNKGIPLING